MAVSNTMVVPASKAKGLEIAGIAGISLNQNSPKLEDALPADIFTFTSFPGPILSAALRVLSGSTCTNEARPSRLGNLDTLSAPRTRRSGVPASFLAIVASRGRRDRVVRERRRDGSLLGFPLPL